MKTFRHDNQPYGIIVFSIDRIESCVADEDSERYQKIRAENGYCYIYGKVVKGSVTNRLFQYTSTTDLTGEDYNLCVSPKDLELGYRVIVAM